MCEPAHCTLHTAHNLLRELRAKTGNRRHRRHRSSVGRYLFSVSYSLQTAVPVGPDNHPPSRSRQVAPGIVARPLPSLQMQMAFQRMLPRCHLRLACNDVQVHFPVWCLDIGLADSPAQKWKTGRRPPGASWGMPQPPFEKSWVSRLRESGG